MVMGAGVYILSLNFKIAPKHAESALKIFIFAPIRTLRVMQYFKICTFCAIFWIIFQKIGQILIKLYPKCQIIEKNLEF